MRLKSEILKHVNVTRFTKYVVFGTCDIAPTVESKAVKGIQYISRFATEMLSQDLLSHAIRMDDIANLLGVSTKEAKRAIRNSLKIGQECYDGTYGVPGRIEPENAIYIVTALALHEYGRKSSNINEYVAMTFLQDYVDIGVLETEYDMACYAFLLEYFLQCLEVGKIPITKYIKEFAGQLVTSKRLMNLFRKNSWYGDLVETEAIIGVASACPKLSDITNAILEQLTVLLMNEQQQYEQRELDKAFDSQKTKVQ